VFECVINISEGRDVAVLDELSRAARASLRDRHSDASHHRSVFTLINDPTPLVRDVHSLIDAAYQRLDLTTHRGVHPRFGVVDVVPFVALDPTQFDVARGLRDDLARWLAEQHQAPVFLYGRLDDGSTRTLPEVRRDAFRSLSPDFGPAGASERLGAVAVGERAILVAWNLWLTGVAIDQARDIARSLRRPALRTLAFDVGDHVQVSCNIVDTEAVLLSQTYDEVLALLPEGGALVRAELVGLIPASLLEREDPARWAQLGLSRESTIEARSAYGDSTVNGG
jgi:glutamate formiminotransferase